MHSKKTYWTISAILFIIGMILLFSQGQQPTEKQLTHTGAIIGITENIDLTNIFIAATFVYAAILIILLEQAIRFSR